MHKYLQSYNITILYIFRALLCSSSGGSILYVQRLVQSVSVSGHTLHWLRENSLLTSVTYGRSQRELSLNQCNIRLLTDCDGIRCCTYTIEPPEDEHNNARNL